MARTLVAPVRPDGTRGTAVDVEATAGGVVDTAATAITFR